jgi:hypothetical protein
MLQHNKGYIWQTIVLKGKKNKIIFSTVRNKRKVSTLPTLIQYSTGIPSQSNKARERNKKDTNREGRSQIITICRWYDSIHKRPHILHKKLLNLIDTSSNTTEYKIKIFKSVALLWTSWERNQENNLNHSSLKKYLSLNLTKEVKDLFNENYRNFKKET